MGRVNGMIWHADQRCGSAASRYTPDQSIGGGNIEPAGQGTGQPPTVSPAGDAAGRPDLGPSIGPTDNTAKLDLLENTSMRERFSDRARHAMALANREAGRMKHNFLAPAHIMLGLIAEGHCVATEALRVLRVDLDHVRDKVAQQLGTGDATGEVGLRAQTDGTKRVIAQAVADARSLGHRYVGTEHLVLALLECGDNIPSKVLHEEGLEASKLREQILVLLKSDVDDTHDLAHSRHGDFEWMHQQELAKAFRSPMFWHTLVLAVDSANRQGASEIEPHHLLLALLRDEGSAIPKLLEEKGVTLDWVRERTAAQGNA